MNRKSILALLISCIFMVFATIPAPLHAEDPLTTLTNHEVTDTNMGAGGESVTGSSVTASSTAQMEQMVSALENLISEYEKLIAKLEEQVKQAEAASTFTGPTGDIDVNSRLNVRTGPWGAIIGKLSHGDKVLIAAKEGDWFKIRFGDGYGYVHSYYVDAEAFESAKEVVRPGQTSSTTTTTPTTSTTSTTPAASSETPSASDNVVSGDTPSSADTGSQALPSGSSLRVHFMNIGRNDGILIECDGEVAFFDAGMHSYGLKAIKNMKAIGITKLKYYVGTHGHADHIGGGAAIIEALNPDEVLVPPTKVKSAIQSHASGNSEKTAANNAKYTILKRGGSVMLGNAKLECLGPIKVIDTAPGSSSENSNSMVLKLTYGNKSFLLTGDTTGSILTSIDKESPGCLKADVFKSPHHNGGVSKTVLKLVSPRYVVVSTSKDCMPGSSYKSTCKSVDAKMLITVDGEDGHIRMTSDGESINVESNVKF